MKLLCLIFATLALAIPASAQSSYFVGSASNAKTVSVQVTTASGNTLAVHCGNTAAAQPRVSSSSKEPYRVYGYNEDGNLAGEWFSGQAAAANPTVTCSYPDMIAFADVFVEVLPGYQAEDGTASQNGSSSAPAVSFQPNPANKNETILAAAVCSSACPAMWTPDVDANGNGATYGSIVNGAGLGWNMSALLFTGTPSAWLGQAIGFYPASPPTVASMGLRLSYTDANGNPRSIDIEPGANTFTVSALLNMSDGSQTVAPTATATLTVTPN